MLSQPSRGTSFTCLPSLSRNKPASSPLLELLNLLLPGLDSVENHKHTSAFLSARQNVLILKCEMEWLGSSPPGWVWDSPVKHAEMISWEFLKFENKGKIFCLTSQVCSIVFFSAMSVGWNEMLETLGGSQWGWFICSSDLSSWCPCLLISSQTHDCWHGHRHTLWHKWQSFKIWQ